MSGYECVYIYTGDTHVRGNIAESIMPSYVYMPAGRAGEREGGRELKRERERCFSAQPGKRPIYTPARRELPRIGRVYTYARAHVYVYM